MSEQPSRRAKEPESPTPASQTGSPEPSIAPGDEDALLNASATPEEIRKGNYTRITRLSWDEGDD